MTYQQTIDYLYQQLPMFSRIGTAAYKNDLHNTIDLCAALNNPHTKFKSIHIAGTNGKGSTSHMLAALLQQAGYKTGLYTSPHLKDFRERIKLNGQMIPQNFVIDFVERTKELTAKIQPSFFELTVAMAFDFFATEKVDIALIETGLGGRLDSTNIITPILSCITNIGWDHMNILGDSLAKIAAEKAGIIKKGIPVVVGEYLPETKQLFIEKAREENAQLSFVQDEYQASDINISASALRCSVTNIQQQATEDFTLDLNGLYQVKNLCTVLCAESILHQLGFNISKANEKFALANTKKITEFQGRWQVLQQSPAVILDVAHNEAGITQVLQHLLTVYPKQPYHFVIGMVKDKEIDAVLKLLPATAVYYFTNAHIPRALPAKDLLVKAAVYGLQGNCYDDVNEAIKAAKNNARQEAIIMVCGSVFLIGEVAAE